MRDLGDKKFQLYIKFVIFDGIGFWLDYCLYFDVCVMFNNWNE